MPLETVKKRFETTVPLTILYGSGVWRLNHKEENQRSRKNTSILLLEITQTPTTNIWVSYPLTNGIDQNKYRNSCKNDTYSLVPNKKMLIRASRA